MVLVKHILGSILAAVSMYTRLPAWHLMSLGEGHYQRAAHFIPLVGLLTGGLMALVFSVCYYLVDLPQVVAIIIAFSARLIFTGAFHEDGLGDFFDGFGGGRDKESILRIMKDSYVGSYAVIGYVMYYLLVVALLTGMRADTLPSVLLVSDILAKCCVLRLIALPYARRGEESKIQLIYSHTRKYVPILLLLIALCVMYLAGCPEYCLCLLALFVFTSLFTRYVKYKIGGYTGDTCGAIILLGELISYLTIYIYFN